MVAQLPDIDLDPCSDPSRATPAKQHIVGSEGGDGLAGPWAMRVWMNPPYSDTATWCAKATRETDSGRSWLVIGLIPFRPEGFWAKTVWNAHAVGHFHRRIRFEHPRCVLSEQSGRFPSALVLWGALGGMAQQHITAQLADRGRHITWVNAS